MAENAVTFYLDAQGGPKPGPLTLSSDTFHIEVPLDDGSDLRLKFYLEPSRNKDYLHKESYNLGVMITSSQRSVIFRTILKTDITSKCYTSSPMKEICRADVIIDKDAYRNQVIMDSVFTYNLFFPKPSTDNCTRYGKAKMTFEIDIFMSTFLNEPLSFYGAGTSSLIRSCSYQRRGVLVQNLKKFYYSGENLFSDLKLKSRDNMTINAHKMILAARSPHLKNLLETKIAQSDFDGTLQIDDVDAKPLISVLHWIYTEELPDGCGRYIGDIAATAALFKLEELLDLLNKTMSRYCNPQNMFELFRVAERHTMKIAMAHISAFIKMNVDSLAGLTYTEKQVDHVQKKQELPLPLKENGLKTCWQIRKKIFFEEIVFKIFGEASACVLLLTLLMMFYFNFMMK